MLNFFNRLLKPDPLADWPEAGSVAVLEYDFDRKTLCGVPIGSPLAAFRKLGKPKKGERYSAGAVSLRYLDRGLRVETEQGHVLDCTFYWSDEWGDPQPAAAFNGRIKAKGGERRWTAKTTEAEIVAALGKPSSRDADDDEIELNYDFGPIGYRFELTPDGFLREMELTAEESMKRD